jgi:hypothetical protein
MTPFVYPRFTKAITRGGRRGYSAEKTMNNTKQRERISRRQLEDIASSIGERDAEILRAVGECRYLTTGQIRWLYFDEAATTAAALRAANRAVTKLKDYGLLCSLSRRIGGARAGSGSYVWTLTDAGARLLLRRNV